ncbi:hypothetical protein QOT17_000072 [Balamuthia mandrillaris]
MRIHQRRQCITLACILLLLDTDVTYSPHLTHSALHTNKGKGKGRNKSRPLVLKRVNVVALVRRNPNLVKQHLHISLEVFDLLVLDLQPFKKHLTANSSLKCLSFENKIYLCLKWLAHYEGYGTLAFEFGVSNFDVSQVIKETLPVLAVHFLQYIPNRIETTTTSSMSNQVVAIIDGTIHPVPRPAVSQHKLYRKDKGCHFIQSLLLVDFDGYIISVSSGYEGHNLDSTAARHNNIFRAILQQKFALDDPGFGLVDYIVTGLRTNQMVSKAHVIFDALSRSEQMGIEHINNFFKSLLHFPNVLCFCTLALIKEITQAYPVESLCNTGQDGLLVTGEFTYDSSFLNLQQSTQYLSGEAIKSIEITVGDVVFTLEDMVNPRLEFFNTVFLGPDLEGTKDGVSIEASRTQLQIDDGETSTEINFSDFLVKDHIYMSLDFEVAFNDGVRIGSGEIIFDPSLVTPNGTLSIGDDFGIVSAVFLIGSSAWFPKDDLNYPAGPFLAFDENGQLLGVTLDTFVEGYEYYGIPDVIFQINNDHYNAEGLAGLVSDPSTGPVDYVQDNEYHVSLIVDSIRTTKGKRVGALQNDNGLKLLPDPHDNGVEGLKHNSVINWVLPAGINKNDVDNVKLEMRVDVWIAPNTWRFAIRNWVTNKWDLAHLNLAPRENCIITSLNELGFDEVAPYFSDESDFRIGLRTRKPFFTKLIIRYMLVSAVMTPFS